jgi:hypothetical protein
MVLKSVFLNDFLKGVQAGGLLRLGRTYCAGLIGSGDEKKSG